MEDKNDDGLNRREVLATFVGATLLAGAASTASAQAKGGGGRGTRVTYPPSDPKLFAEIDAVLKRTEAIWAAQEWWRLPKNVRDSNCISVVAQR